MNVRKTLVTGVVGGLLMLTGLPAAQAADTTPMDANPGPAGSFSWKGLNWQKRSWGGAPHFNGLYDPANVSGPDADGHVTLSITNPTGKAPVAAEFQTTRRGFGYGTYTTVVEKNVSAMQEEAVWGCLFTYDPDAIPGHTEVDLCEASAWGGGAAWGESWPVEQGHGYWFDATKAPGQGNNTVSFAAPTSNIVTHRMEWSPGKIVFETYEGENFVGPLVKRTVLEGPTVPVPGKEHLVYNFWVTGGGGGDPTHVKPESVTIRDFSFTPVGTLAPTGSTGATTTDPTPAPSQSTPATDPIALSAVTAKTKGEKSTTLRWTGAKTAVVDLFVNGKKTTILNTGTYIFRSKGAGASTFQVCTSAGCSNKVTA